MGDYKNCVIYQNYRPNNIWYYCQPYKTNLMIFKWLKIFLYSWNKTICFGHVETYSIVNSSNGRNYGRTIHVFYDMIIWTSHSLNCGEMSGPKHHVWYLLFFLISKHCCSVGLVLLIKQVKQNSWSWSKPIKWLWTVFQRLEKKLWHICVTSDGNCFESAKTSIGN